MSESGAACAIRLESGTSRDLDSLMEVMQAAFDPRFGEGWTRSQCAGILPMNGVELVIARNGDDDRPLGFSLSRTVSDEAELLLLAVKPEHQRNGVGKKLLDRFLNTASDAGASHVHLEVREGNPAIKLYRAARFSIAGRRRKYYRGSDGSQYDALTLARAL